MIQDSLDTKLHSLPGVGVWFQRTYAYFKSHTAVTNFMHIAAGLGVGFIIAGGDLMTWGILFLSLSVAGHIYAFLKAS